jgi:hypothetical protein
MMKTKTRKIFFGILILMIAALIYLSMPVFIDIYTSLNKYNARMTQQADYTKITTALPKDVVNDLCQKFNINPNDKRCLPDSLAFGPDFFGDIKKYFKDVPQKEATAELVNSKLGKYMVMCDKVNREGSYECDYDLRGDGIYPISIYFTKDGYFYRIIADTSGS